jgi:transcriptional regulator with XRE-family HTH domain
MANIARIKHPIKPTTLGQNVLRARFSLRETQPEFAERFQVTNITIHNWETGKTSHIQRIHRTILDGLVAKLKKEGRWMPYDIFSSFYRTDIERKGNANV